MPSTTKRLTKKPVNQKTTHKNSSTAKTAIAKYLDFVITATRVSPANIEVGVYESPAGKLDKPVLVKFSKKLETEMYESFVGTATAQSGRMNIRKNEAIKLGKVLSAALLPWQVYSLLADSLQKAASNANTGLRIRLALHPELMNLPWEYLYRPDSEDSDATSGFLMLDPLISIVREAANPRISIAPIKGKQELLFVGTYWGDGTDPWEVKTEFTKLREGLKPVSRYLSYNFKKASNAAAFNPTHQAGAAIFHYAGHCDTDKNGDNYLIREVPVPLVDANLQVVYASEIARAFAKSSARLVVLSACNSGYWASAKPWLDAGVAAVVGINGKVASDSTNEFFPKMYESLAIGLTLDEAISRARFHLVEWGLANDFFDWGLYMVYMPSPEAVLFPRTDNVTLRHQEKVKQNHKKVVKAATNMVKQMDKTEYKEPINESLSRQVLILGRFSPRRKKILDALRNILKAHPGGYIPLLLDGKKPKGITLGEWGLFAAITSKFIIADISEAKSIPDELRSIVPNCPSRPVVPIFNQTGRDYALAEDWALRGNVARPTIRYKNEEELEKKMSTAIIPAAEKLMAQLVLPVFTKG